MSGIPFNVPYLAGRELEYLTQVIETKRFQGNGPFTVRVQRLLEARYGAPHVLLTTSCTAALELAALLLDLGPGDEVLMPSYTFCSTASAFLRTGARPVFCEIDPATMTISPSDASARVTSRTKAIVPVHYAGLAADMPAVRALADRSGLTVVEDAAQGLHARLGGQWLGTLSPLAAFSFHETKNLHCGLGGALVLNDPSYFDRAEDIWERGTDRGKQLKGLVDKYSWVELGSSFYPTELQAAFLLAQLECQDQNLAERGRITARYRAELAPLAATGAFQLPAVGPDREVNHHAFWLLFDRVADCDRVREHLAALRIMAYIGYVPLHSSRMGLKLGNRAEDLPVTESCAERILRLPFYNTMSDDDTGRVCQEIARALGLGS